jgi:hypothetical protein
MPRIHVTFNGAAAADALAVTAISAAAAAASDALLIGA